MARKAVQGYAEKTYYDNTRFLGMLATLDTLQEGYFRHLVNVDISDTGQSVKPRDGFLTSTVNVNLSTEPTTVITGWVNPIKYNIVEIYDYAFEVQKIRNMSRFMYVNDESTDVLFNQTTTNGHPLYTSSAYNIGNSSITVTINFTDASGMVEDYDTHLFTYARLSSTGHGGGSQSVRPIAISWSSTPYPKLFLDFTQQAGARHNVGLDIIADDMELGNRDSTTFILYNLTTGTNTEHEFKADQVNYIHLPLSASLSNFRLEHRSSKEGLYLRAIYIDKL